MSDLTTPPTPAAAPRAGDGPRHATTTPAAYTDAQRLDWWDAHPMDGPSFGLFSDGRPGLHPAHVVTAGWVYQGKQCSLRDAIDAAMRAEGVAPVAPAAGAGPTAAGGLAAGRRGEIERIAHSLKHAGWYDATLALRELLSALDAAERARDEARELSERNAAERGAAELELAAVRRELAARTAQVEEAGRELEQANRADVHNRKLYHDTCRERDALRTAAGVPDSVIRNEDAVRHVADLRTDLAELRERSAELRSVHCEIGDALREFMPEREMSFVQRCVFAVAALRTRAEAAEGALRTAADAIRAALSGGGGARADGGTTHPDTRRLDWLLTPRDGQLCRMCDEYTFYRSREEIDAAMPESPDA